MEAAVSSFPGSLRGWRSRVLPREHGGWSLAFEPLVLGLLVAPSVRGAWFALALGAAFLMRRPFCDGWGRRQGRRESRKAALVLALVSAVGIVGAFLQGPAKISWMVPSAMLGALFVALDFRGDGRSAGAEFAGAAAFALTPAVFASLAGWGPEAAASLGAVMLCRSVQTVACLRSYLRELRTGVRRVSLPLALAAAALALTLLLVRAALAPATAATAMAVFAARTAFLILARPQWRARRVGMAEAALGIGFVILMGVSWPR